MIACTNHSDREASGMCTNCGKPFCSDCLVEIGGKNYCKPCASSVFSSPAAPVSSASPVSASSENQPSYNTFVALMLCLFLGMLGIHQFYMGDGIRGCIYLCLTLLLGWTIIVPLIIGICCIADFIEIIYLMEERKKGNSPS